MGPTALPWLSDLGGLLTCLAPLWQVTPGLLAASIILSPMLSAVGPICHGPAPVCTGASLRLRYPSVGATEVLMMAACLADGTTTIRNAAMEPEVGIRAGGNHPAGPMHGSCCSGLLTVLCCSDAPRYLSDYPTAPWLSAPGPTAVCAFGRFLFHQIRFNFFILGGLQVT